jgi:hypothetical protein
MPVKMWDWDAVLLSRVIHCRSKDNMLYKFFYYAKQNNTPVFFVAGAIKFIFCIRTCAIL